MAYQNNANDFYKAASTLALSARAADKAGDHAQAASDRAEGTRIAQAARTAGIEIFDGR